MRDILFRGRRKDDHEWIYGDLVCRDMICDHLESTENATGTYYDQTPYVGFVDVFSETVGQFTGLFDKNDRKIFEDDIVKTKYGRLCVVTWLASREHNGWDLFVVETFENCMHTNPPDQFDLYDSDNLEVIGNVHDNPELLGGKHDN